MLDWRKLFDQWAPALLLFARQQTGYLDEAEDVVQEAFVKVWQRYSKEASIPSSLLFKTVRTTAIDLARSRTRRSHREEHSQTGEETSESWFVQSIEARERNHQLEASIKQLSPDQQSVVILKIWGEHSFEDIGRILEISPNTAASRYRYALENLRKTLKPTLI